MTKINIEHIDNNKLIKKSVILLKPLVSIVIATYRRDNSLERALLSLVNQTYDHLEVIVVDDNADEDWNNKVEKIVKKIQYKLNEEWIYIQNKENKGSAEARNIGIKRAKGDYITFLDDDDIYMPNKIKNQAEHMLESQSDYSITDLHLYDEKDRLTKKRHRNYIKNITKENLLRYHLMYHITGTDTMMFKKNYLLNIGGFSPIDVGDEFYLMQKAIEAEGRFSYLPVCDVIAYVHTKTEGLSSGERKITGENKLYQHKRKYFSVLSSRDKRYINMRHYAVLAFTELRRKHYWDFLLYAIKSFFSDPIGCVRLFVEKSY